MALINCPDCNKEISDKAPTCPGCGAPISAAAEITPKGTFIPYSDQQVAVMLSSKKNTSHILHFILSLLTAGVWVIVWIIVALSNNIENGKIDRKIAKGKKIR